MDFLPTTPVAARRVNHLFVYICFFGIFVEQSQRRTIVRYRVTRERPDEAKNWRHRRERISSRWHCVSARLKRAYTHTRAMSRRRRRRRRLRRRKSEGKGEFANSRRVSGGHLRLGHFVLSPCSVFTVVRRRKEATYAPVRSSLPSRLHCLINGRRFSW